MTEVEDRLRADLPRLADLIARGPNEELPTVVSPGERPRGRWRAMASAVAVCVLLGGVATVLARRHPAPTPASRPSRAVVRGQWRPLPPSPLGRRGGAVAVWTGHDVLVWGGYRGNDAAPLAFQSGAAYDPKTGSWRKIADNQWAHPGAFGVWAKDRLFILAKNGGAQYDPATDSWHDIALLPSGTDGGLLAAAWSGTTLFGVVAERAVGTIAVAHYDSRRDAWTIGRTVHVSSQAVGNVSTVWTGHGLVVSVGARAVWAYDPARNAWHSLASLPSGATSTSIAAIGGKLEAVYVAGGSIRAARSVGDGWRTIATSPHTSISRPLSVDAGGTLVAIDRSGRAKPLLADPATGRWESLGEYPLPPGANGTAVWASTGLFVWGGLPSSTPASFSDPTPNKADAAWYDP